MWRAGLLLVAVVAATARADDGANIDEQRDVFGFKKKKKPVEEPLDCSDGTAFGCTGASDPLDDNDNPYALSTWLPASYLLRLPVGDASHDAVAHYGLGASRDEAGPLFAGATGLENRWTLHGAPIDGVRTGAADTRIPLAFLDGIVVGAGGFTARDRVSTGGLVEARLLRPTNKHVLRVRAWAGYTLPNRQRPIAPFTYQARRGALDIGPEASVHATWTRPGSLLGRLFGVDSWSVHGIGVEVSSRKLTWTSGTTRDRDQDGTIDGLPGVVPVDRVDRYSRRPVTWRVPLMGVNLMKFGSHEIETAIVGQLASDVFYLYNSTLRAAGIQGRSLTADAIVTYRGRWKNTRALAQLAWHRSQREESAIDDAAANAPQLLSAYIPTMLEDDPTIARACTDSPDPNIDPYPLVTNCPVPIGWFASGGAGLLTDTTADRPSLTANLAHRVGNNVVRVGATGEDTRLVTTKELTGGYQVRSLFPEHRSERRFVAPETICATDVSLPCATVNESELRYRTRYTAAYVEDTWRPNKAIAIDAGLRWELMWVGPVLHFSNQLAPRLGASWDPVGGGRSRVWASMGRSYAMLPAGLGATILQRDRTVDYISSPFGEGRSADPGAVFSVPDDVQPIAQDELTTGAQVALARTVRATVWLQGRWLRRGLDTTTTGFDNPGRAGGTPAIRETGLFAAELATAPTAKLVLRAGYMYGRTIGSWTGAFDPRQGAVLYAGDDYDATSVNLLGRLPTDIGHRTYVEAGRRGQLGSVEVGVAVRLTAGSGRPRSALADAEDGTIYLIPRGLAGRGPVLTQSNVRMSARWHDIDFTLDVFNVFNRRDATNIDEIYANGALRPIDRGTSEDLIWLKNDAGTETTRRGTFSHATAYQSPLSAVLGIHRAF